MEEDVEISRWKRIIYNIYVTLCRDGHVGRVQTQVNVLVVTHHLGNGIVRGGMVQHQVDHR